MSVLRPLIGAALAALALGHSNNPSAADALLTFDGFTRPQRVVNVGAATDALLAAVHVERGDTIRAGEVLAELEFSVEQANADLARLRAEQVADLHTAEIQLAHKTQRLEQRRALVADGILSQEEFAETVNEHRLAELALEGAREEAALAQREYARARAVLARGTIHSAIDGVVVERYLSPGEVVTKSGATPIVQLAQLHPLRVQVTAPVEAFTDIAVGRRARVRLLEPFGSLHDAEVSAVDRVFDAASGTFRFELALPNPDHGIPAGVRCQVLLER